MTTIDFAHHLAQAQQFIWSYARLIDRQLFAYLFTNGKAEPVLTALRAYQNPDGGFGNALEPDKRDPHSQPVDIEEAWRILDYLGEFPEPLVRPACDFLLTITTPEGGVPFALPTVNAYPHAPWWTVSERPAASLNPTAALCGLLHKYGVQHHWLERATTYCWQNIAASETTDFHTVKNITTFLNYVPERAQAEKELQRLRARIQQADTIAYETAINDYRQGPLQWAPTPASPLHSLFDQDTLDTHLQALARQQQQDGGWLLNWEPISKAVEYEWRGRYTIDTLHTLQAYTQKA